MKLDTLRQLSNSLPPLEGEALEGWLQGELARMGYNPRAIYAELEMSSPLVDTHRDISYSNAQMSLHSHAFYELIYSVNAEGTEYLVGSHRYRLEAGDIIFIPPGVSHRPLLPDHMTEPYTRYVLWLSQEFMEWYAKLFPYPFQNKQSTSNMLRTKDTEWAHLGALFLLGVQEAEARGDGWEAAVLGNTVTLLTQMKRATDGHTAKHLRAETPELLDQITDYIERHYGEEITLDLLSRRFFVSSSTISHLFKQKLGVSLYRYVTQRRLIAAKSFIETGLPLERVATQSGFCDYSVFFRAFKGAFGISPRQYKAIQ